MANEVDYIIEAVYALLAVVSATLNILLATVLARADDDDHIAKVMLSLTMSDLGAGTFVPFLSAVFAWVESAEVPYWLVVLVGSIFHMCVCSSIWHLTLTSVLKCYVIARPLSHAAVLTARLRNRILAAIWLNSCALVIIADLAGVRWRITVPGIVEVSPINLKAALGVRYFETGFIFLLTSVIISSSYIKILFVVRQHHATIGQLTTAAPVASGNNGWAASIKSAKSLFIICVAYYLTYVPGVLVNIGFAVPDWYRGLARVIMFSSASINSLLYIILNSSIRKTFMQMFCDGCLPRQATASVHHLNMVSCQVHDINVPPA